MNLFCFRTASLGGSGLERSLSTAAELKGSANEVPINMLIVSNKEKRKKEVRQVG